MSDVGERLAWILERRVDAEGKRWSQRSLSLAAGLSSSHVGQLVRGRLGKRPAAETLTAIAKAAGVSARWLMTGAGDPLDHSDHGEAEPDEAAPSEPVEPGSPSTAFRALTELGQGRKQAAAEALARLAIAGDERAVTALEAAADGHWRDAIALLAQVAGKEENGTKA